MFRFNLIFFLLFCAFAQVAKAQFDAQFSQYWISKSYYNPAATGLTSDINVAAQFRQQWVGVKNAPQSFVFNGEMPAFFLGKNHGVGLSLFNESIGLYKNLSIGLQYSYGFRILGGNLRIGIQPSVISSKFDGTQVEIPNSGAHNPNDPSIPTTEVNGTAFDLSLGTYYQRENLYIGFSYMHLIKPTMQLGETNETYIPGTLYATAGYTYLFPNSLLEITPSFLFKSDMIFSQCDFNVMLTYNDRIFGGAGYRLGDAFNLCFGLRFGKVKFGYSYDIGTSAIGRASKGSHEVFATYTYKLDLKSGFLLQGRKRSVRFM
ncbi:MAG: PorP/SprF family type IX secretion system membrane protein [Bacteroidales bacterium]